MNKSQVNKKLESIREAIRNESVSYGDIAELQDLQKYIEAGDNELLEAAGVPEEWAQFTGKEREWLYQWANYTNGNTSEFKKYVSKMSKLDILNCIDLLKNWGESARHVVVLAFKNALTK